MWWKIYFWITIVELVLQFLGLFVNPGIRIATQIAIMIVFAIAVVGMYGFAFHKKLATQLFWQYFTWIYALLDLVYLVYAAAPTAPVLSNLSFLQIYPNQTFLEILLGVGIDIPLVYAMYRLTKDEPFAKKPVTTKNEPFRWGMIQTALWGYSVVLIFYLLLVFLLPSGDSPVAKKEASDPTYVAGMFAPLVIFWVWVVLQYKKYKWNWWRTTLALNGLLYSGIIFWGIFFPQEELSSQASMAGIDVISLLQLLIMLLGLWVFGKTQFHREGK